MTSVARATPGLPCSVSRLSRSFAVTAVMTSLSRLFGYARDAVIFVFVSNASGALDAFFVAFRIPNFLRRLSAEGAFSQAFVPVFVETRERNPEDLRPLIDATAGALSVILLGVTVLGVIAAPVLIWIFAPGFITGGGPRAELATDLLRLTFPYVLFISLTAMAGGMLNAIGRFALPAVTPVLLNLSLIAATLWLAPRLEEPAMALGIGVFVAGIAQLLVQVPSLARAGLLPRPRWNWQHSGLRRVLRLMLPALFGSSVVQINLLFGTLVASFLAVGSVSWLYLSDRFVELPLALFGISTATILLPRLSQCSARDDRDDFRNTLDWGVRLGLVVALPSAAGLMLLAQPILITLLQYREFGAYDAQMAGWSLAAFASGLPAFVLVKVLAPGFYAHQDTRTPVRIGVIAMLANMVLTVAGVFAWLSFHPHGAHTALALATAAAAFLNAWLLYRELVRGGRYRADTGTAALLARSAAATILMAIVLWGLAPAVSDWLAWDFSTRMLSLLGLLAAGAATYGAALWLLGARAADLRTA